jgi:hypothetical protein
VLLFHWFSVVRTVSLREWKNRRGADGFPAGMETRGVACTQVCHSRRETVHVVFEFFVGTALMVRTVSLREWKPGVWYAPKFVIPGAIPLKTKF